MIAHRTSGYKNDCAIHSMLSCKFPKFLQLPLSIKNQIANTFRRTTMVSYISTHYKSTLKDAYASSNPLREEDLKPLATYFSVGIFVYAPKHVSAWIHGRKEGGKLQPKNVIFLYTNNHYEAVSKNGRFIFTAEEIESLEKNAFEQIKHMLK